MDSHPVLRLLAQDETPTQGSLRNTAIVVAQCPSHLPDLAQEDLFDDLLSLLPNRAGCFSKLLVILGAQVSDKHSYSRLVTPFIQQLVRSAKELLSQRDYQGLLCAALQLCSANHERWKVLKEVASCGTTLELLTASVDGHTFLLKWVLGFNEVSLDAITLDDWTHRMVTLVESCSASHRFSTALLRHQKMEILKQALRRAIEHSETTVRTSSSAQGSKSQPRETIFDHVTMQLFMDFGLAVPQSQRMCDNHLESLCHEETLSILREILKLYPCQICEDSVRNGSASSQIHRTLEEEYVAPEVLEEPLFVANEGIGEWQIALSSRAYRNLQSYDSDPKIRKALGDTLRELAGGNAKSKLLEFKHEPPKIPLRVTKWRSDTLFLWQVDVTPGPGPYMEQQAIKVWTVGSRKNFESMLDEIKKYQKSLPDLRVARCLEESPLLLSRRRPKIYDQLGVAPDLPTCADLDIRFINQEFIDTFNKSFTITEHLIRAIVEGDLSAEFPFDLSQTELQIIQHTQTPTLIMGRSGTGKTTCLMFKMIAKYIASCKVSPEEQARQALVTRSETLAEKLQSYSRSLVATLSQKAIVPTLPFKPELSDQRTLLELEPSDFPLVCNYDQFLVMLETAVNAYDRGAPRDVSKKLTRTNLVDFKAFRNIYWPHFPLDLIKGLSPHLVFSDIMGMIKGSVQTCKTLISLQAQEYKDLSARVAPNVTSASDRVKVFRIFELYEKLKHKAGEHDSIDRVVHILKQIRSDMNLRALLADCVQEFYIDEVQDFRCLDIELFLTLGNDSRAFNFGGDTAQGISQDSSFRFQDVKALFYDHFSRQSVAIGQEALAQPQLFTLNRNYRSHQGILSLASSVMSLLWRNFPDNVDNLGPEVGSLAGPVPVLFLGCDTSILLHNDPGDSSSPAHELLFGAEQVILTRDDVGKDKLIQKIGETALVLTILQAKGMEFDDVILWDFFSTTPDPAGWRSLQHSSHGESSRFDVVKHAAICSELKHLYVAITRARVRFIMIEGIEEAAQPFVELMVKKSTLALLEVTSPTSTDFIEKIKVLQPRRSDNPQRWLAIGGDMMARGLFAEACLCFRRAEDRPREEHAKAHLQEVQGIELMARGEELNSHIKLKAAATAFEGLGLTTDATRVLLRLGLPEEAAELWYKKRDFKQAAGLFEKASNYKRASDSWHLNNEQSKAMACLHTGALYDQIVVYFANNKGRLSGPEVLRYQRSTKLLIKQGKISEAYRGAAIGLLGNLAQQEAFYLEYNMIEGLLELYQAQHATAKVLKTLVKLDRLEEALDLASSLPFQDKAVIDQPELSRLQAIVWVDRIYLNLSHAPAIVVEEGRIHTWQHAFHVLRIWDHSSAQEEIMSLESGSLIKAFLCLYTTVNVEGTTSATNYDELPLDLLRETVKIVKGQQPGLNGVVGEAVLLLCGVHRHLDSQQKYNVRAWSPLRKIQQVSRDGNSLNKAAMQWMTSQVSRAVMRVHELARNMFGTKWPTRCSQYLVVGRCTDRNKNRGCTSLHEHVTPSAYMKYLEDLLLMNGLLCEMTVLYHQRVMSEDDSKNFLGARRFWLERLSIALTYVSGFEQDSMVLNEITKSIRTEESLRVVASCLEDHLLYKARNEWKSQGTVGYVLEQLDLAAHLGERVKTTLIRRTREQLRHHNPLTQAAIILLEQLQTHIIGGPSAAYSLALKAYLNGPQGIMKLNWDSNRAFHCHTSVFEGIAFYLLLQISPSSVVIPRSWVDLHLPSILRRNKPNSPLDPNPKMMSRDAVIVLLRHFDDLLEWANERLQAGHQFAACGRSYPSGVLHQRNCELLAVVLCNLYSLCQPTSGSNWQDMLRALEVRLVRLKCLDHTVGNVNGLRNKLLASHSCYRGKNPLLILNVADVHPHPFTAFQRSNNLTSESLTSLRTHLAPAQPSKVTPTLDADQPAQEETAARCIQKHWRKVSPRLKARKAFANSERGRIIVDFHILARGSGLKIRSSLVRLGLVCLSNLGPLGSAISALNKRALDTVEKAGFEDTEVLDMVLGGVSDLREGLTRHNTRLSDEVLGSLVRAKDENGLEEMLQRQLKLLAEDEKVVAELEHILDGVTKGGV